MYTTTEAMIPLTIYDITNLKKITSNINSVTDKFSPSLIYYGNGIYLTKDTNFKNFNSNKTLSFHYLKNIISDRPTSVRNIPCLYFECIAEQLESEDYIKVFSSYYISSIFGQSTAAAKILFDNLTGYFYQPSQKVLNSYITGLPISYDTPTFRSSHLIYIDRALGIIPLMPKLERIVHPLNSYLYANIREKVEKRNDSTYILKTPKTPQITNYDSITFYRPLYLFSTDKIIWKRWHNNSSFEVPANFSLDYDKFISYSNPCGNTYEEMINIPDDAWDTFIGSDANARCWVLCNSYIPVIEVSQDAGEISDSEFFYNGYCLGRYNMMKGSI